MTTVFHTMEVIDYSKKRFDIPDLETDLKKIYDDTQNELADLEFSKEPDEESSFDKQKGRVESELEELKTYAQSSEIIGYQTYAEALERQVEALTWSLLNVARRAENMAQNILSVDNKMDRNEISEEFDHIVADATSELGCDFVLRWYLQSRGWNEWQLDFLENIIPTQTVVGLLVHASTPSNMILGIDNWISLTDDGVTIVNGDDNIHLKKTYGGVLINISIGGSDSSFNTSDLKDIFMDVLHPTQEEIQMYEMASHKVYDIYKWRDIFGRKQK